MAQAHKEMGVADMVYQDFRTNVFDSGNACSIDGLNEYSFLLDGRPGLSYLD